MPIDPRGPLTKATLYLFKEDVEWFQKRFGYGYSGRIRGVIRSYRLTVQRNTFEDPRMLIDEFADQLIKDLNNHLEDMPK